MQNVNRLINLPFRPSREQRSWLEKKREDQCEDVRNAAEWAWEMRFSLRTQPEEELADKIDFDPDELLF